MSNNHPYESPEDWFKTFKANRERARIAGEKEFNTRRMKKFQTADVVPGLITILTGHNTDDGIIYIEDLHTYKYDKEDKND